MTWRDLLTAATKLGVKPDDEIEIEFPDYSGWGPVKFETNFPNHVYREYDVLTLTTRQPEDAK